MLFTFLMMHLGRQFAFLTLDFPHMKLLTA